MTACPARAANSTGDGYNKTIPRICANGGAGQEKVMVRNSYRDSLSRRLLLTGLASFSAVGALPSFANAQGSGLKPLATPQKLVLGRLKSAQLAAIGPAIDKAKALNVDVEIVEFQRFADARTALATGSLDIANIGPQDVSIAVSQGINDIIGIMTVGSWPCYPVVRKGVEIKTWKDLVGKRIGVGPAATTWFQFAASTQEAGIDYKSMQIVNFQGGGATLQQALERGDVDAVISWEPFDSIPVVQGYGYWAKGLDYSKSTAFGGEIGVLGAYRGSIEKKSDAIARFVAALMEASDELGKSPEKLAKAIEVYSGVSPAVAAHIAQRGLVFNPKPDLPQLKRMTREFFKLGVLKADVSDKLDAYYDLRFISK